MMQFIQRINKSAVAYGLIGIACAVVLGMVGWPYLLSHYGMVAAIVFLGIIIVFSAIAAYGFAAHTHIGIKRGHIDLRVYEYQQLSLPYQDEYALENSESEFPDEQLQEPKQIIKALPPHNEMGNLIPQNRMGSGEKASQADFPQEWEMGNPISQNGKAGNSVSQSGMGNPILQSGMGKNIPLNQVTERRQKVHEFFTQHPGATLKEAEQALNIPDATIDRLRKDLISKGAFQ